MIVMPISKAIIQCKSKITSKMFACTHPEGVLILEGPGSSADKTCGKYLAMQLTLEHARDLHNYLGQIWPIGQLKSKQYYSTKTPES